ncbi:MAG: sialate O-acetylesterase [Alistipes sp.]|nr:sialate O-acetylesterase [Alistipes sp.]
MKKFIFLMVCLMVAIESYAQKIKVACVGNSITYGAYVANREQNCFPVQLQAWLGEEYEVVNFGVSGTTALCEGLYPYVRTEQYRRSLDYNPDVVIIKLGTNDANHRNDKWRANFGHDYRELVDVYRNLPSRPRVILMTPVRCFLQSNQDQVICKEIIPVIEQTAYDRNLDIINLHNIFGDKWVEYLMTDRLHPSSIGAGDIVEKIYSYLSVVPSRKADVVGRFAIKPKREFNFHGYKGYEFDNEGVRYYIVEPHQVAEGNPWIWRARFWGHEPQTDIDLLERGFHLTYCEVGDLYGSPKAVERWDTFYKLAVKAGLNRKTVLEGMSRGGLIIYNWAVKNLSKVACIYGDAPVMDLKSWPIGEGKYRGDAGCIKTMMAAYGFTDIAEAKAWQKNPINHAKQFAKSDVALIHVVGDADEIVPVDENTTIFEKAMTSYGGKMTVIHKAGVNHHPHSLNNPKPIVDFILKATGYSHNRCTHPVPGNEYRSAAGWSKGSEWHSVAKDIEQTLEGRNLRLLLLGNSITQGFGGNRQLVTHKVGKQAMDNALGKDVWESAGISGDRTQHLLWRIKNGNYNRCNPENVVITIGVNNVVAGDDPELIAEGIVACAEEARRQMPSSRIILFGLLPAGLEAQSSTRVACDKIHSILATKKIKGVEYINPTEWFVQPDGTLRKELYAGDYLHLSGAGYQMWSEKIAELISK